MGEMQYSEFVEVYGAIASTSGRLEKTSILAEFLKKLKKSGKSEWIYLLKGQVFADYDEREFGISDKLVMKGIGQTYGVSQGEIEEEYKKKGDLGEIAEHFSGEKRQATLFSKKLSVGKVFDNLRGITEIEGKGAVTEKLHLVVEILGNASGREAKYIVRTLQGKLRVGVADATLRDSIAEALFEDDRKEMSEKIQNAYDMSNDFASVFDAAVKGREELEKVQMVLGRPMNVMLPVKVTDIKDAFRICGKPAAIEHKYDGFRVVITKQGKEIKLFTRRLENVTRQFPDVVEIVRKNIKGKDFVIDSEVVGYDPVTKKTKPFEAISQRIRRKYEIEKLVRELPVEVNVFDIVYLNGKSFLKEPFTKRRKALEGAVNEEEFKIRVSKQIVTDSEEEAMKFYEEALKIGEEGIMVKNLEASYHQGRKVGYMVKLKPVANDLDLVIVGAEYGSGKRAGWLTSYIVACVKNGEFLEVGKVSSGLKELEQEGGTTYDEMTKLLRPLITSEKGKVVRVKPKIIVAVTYQNIQGSPSYSSGYAMRFPRITAYRPDKSVKEIATLKEIEKEVGKGRS